MQLSAQAVLRSSGFYFDLVFPAGSVFPPVSWMAHKKSPNLVKDLSFLICTDGGNSRLCIRKVRCAHQR
ncbi:MAG: hypothetical protein KDD28_12200, partial [Phaeodactylibacter sp.]|nr:hypothetical protein [Phaeodactylibacter sp.]